MIKYMHNYYNVKQATNIQQDFDTLKVESPMADLHALIILRPEQPLLGNHISGLPHQRLCW